MKDKTLSSITDKNLSSITDKLVDGKDIDWQDQQDMSADELLILEQLSSIEKISKVFDKKYELKNKAYNQSQDNQLFSWGHLLVVEKIGEGSFGNVYRAYDPILDRDVALKLFKQGDFQSLQSRNLIHEAKRLAKVRNEHVLAIHGANIYDERTGIWSDLILGEDLSEKGKQHNYDCEELLNIALEISYALIAVHKAGIIHGDIKPSNIMFHDENKKYILMDFGAGTERSTQNNVSEVSSGTPLFMAPELFDNQNISRASDIYAFGVLLFKLATKVYPIMGKNIADIYSAHEKQQYKSLDKLRSDLPKPLRHMITSMLSVNPINRPSAKLLKQKIKWIISAPIRRKKKLLISTVIGALIIGIMLSSFGFYQANESKKIAVLEKEKAQSVNTFLQDMLSSAAKLGKGREVKIADMLDIAARDVKTKFNDKPRVKAATLDAIGMSYQHLLLPQKSIDIFTESLNLKKQWLADESVEMFKSQLQLADSFRLQHDIDKSNELINHVLKLASKNADVNKKLIDFSHIRLANNYNYNSDFQKAESLYNTVIENMSDYNESGPIPYLVYLGLAENYLSQTKFLLARDTIEKALIELNRMPNSSVRNLIAIKDTQARIMINLGEFDIAEKNYNEMLNLTEKHFGKDNVLYLKNLTNFAAALQEKGEFNRAMKFLQQAQDLSSRILSEGDSTKIKININLANLKVSLGLLSQGEDIMRSTLDIARKSLGESHIDTLTLEYNLAELLNKNSKFSESLELAFVNNAKMSQTLGEKHLYTLLSLDNIAVSKTGLKHYQIAEIGFKQILNDIEQTIGNKNPYMILVQQHLIDLLIESNQSATVELQVLIDLQTQLFGKDHVDTIASQKKLDEIMSNQNHL